VTRVGDDEELRRGSAVAGSDADRNPEFLLTCVADLDVEAAVWVEVAASGSAPASVGAARLCAIITAAHDQHHPDHRRRQGQPSPAGPGAVFTSHEKPRTGLKM